MLNKLQQRVCASSLWLLILKMWHRRILPERTVFHKGMRCYKLERIQIFNPEQEHITGFRFGEVLRQRLKGVKDWDEKVQITKILMEEYHSSVWGDLIENAYRDNSEQSRLVRDVAAKHTLTFECDEEE